MPTPILADADSNHPESRPVELAQTQAQVPGAAGETIGQVSAVEGSVTITHPDGTKVQATAGAPIFQGDLVETAETGAIGITFADDSTFSLADNGSMVIDQMIYDPGSQSGKSAISVAQGVFTFVSGQIAKTDVDAMVIKTPVAVIGIRGTAGGGKAGPEGTPNTYSIFFDSKAGNVGEMTVKSLSGIGDGVILNQPLQTTQLTSQFVPPLKPVFLPPQVAQTFYAKATTTAPAKPVIERATGPTGDQGGPTAPTAPAADKAAADAFEQALAGGAAIDAALVSAVNTAGVEDVKAVLEGNPLAFGTVESAAAIVTGITAQFVNKVIGLSGDPLSAGMGDGANFDRDSKTQNLDPVLKITQTGLVGGIGGLPGGGNFFTVVFGPRPPVLPPKIVALLPPPLPPPDLPPPSGFDEVIFGTLGNDVLNSSPGANTQFIMVQGISLGGTDTVNGFDGIDQIKIDDVSGIDAVYNQTGATTGTINYAGAVTGSISLDSIEQIFFDNGLEGFQLLDFDSTDVGHFGYLRAGDGTNNTLSTAAGTTLAGSLGTVTGCDALLLGSIIFGNAGDDMLTGSSQGDIIFGGTGNDILDGNLAGDEGGDKIFGGPGDDTFNIAVASAILVNGNPEGSYRAGETGETNGDTLNLVTAGTYTFATPGHNLELNGFEVLSLQVVGITAVAPQSFFGGLTSVTALTGTNTLKSSDATLDMFSVTDTNTNVTNLLATDGGSGVTIRDFNDAGGRTINGSANADTLSGLAGNDDIDGLAGNDTINGGTGADTLSGDLGADTIDLGSDANADIVVYHSINDGTAFGSLALASADDINNFIIGGGDKIEFDNVSMGLNGGASATIAAVVQNGVDTSGASTDGVFYIVSQNAANLDNFSQVVAAIGTVAVDPNDRAVILLARTGVPETGIYVFQDDGSANTTIDAGELALLGVVDDGIDHNNVQVSGL